MEVLVCPNNQCTGCMACKESCPVGAVTVEDRILHYSALIDEKKCVHCDACRRVCQNHHPPALARPAFWKQGWANDPGIRESSSSGGYAAAIQKSFIHSGGAAAGCIFRAGEFTFRIAEKPEDAEAFKGSKYVKSNPASAYKKIRQLLKSGRKVLFTGLPCQTAGVINYCADCSENLYTIDLICHGTPSPAVLDSYLKGKKIDPGTLTDILFRAKKGLPAANEVKIVSDGFEDYYTMCFLDGTILGETCFECRYAGFDRVADLTLGDPWGSGLPYEERRKGASLALCMTKKGEELLKEADLYLTDVDIEKVKKINTQLTHPMEKPVKRELMLEGIRQGKSFSSMIRRLYPKLYYKEQIKTLLSAAGLYKRKNLFHRYEIRVVKKQ